MAWFYQQRAWPDEPGTLCEAIAFLPPPPPKKKRSKMRYACRAVTRILFVLFGYNSFLPTVRLDSSTLYKTSIQTWTLNRRTIAEFGKDSHRGRFTRRAKRDSLSCVSDECRERRHSAWFLKGRRKSETAKQHYSTLQRAITRDRRRRATVSLFSEEGHYLRCLATEAEW
jgi:hypothetical protein